jgi:hypothetical protein
MTGETSEQQKRKDDTRRKILVGAAALDLMTKDAAFAAEFTGLLNHYVRKPQDRALFDFLSDRRPD